MFFIDDFQGPKDFFEGIVRSVTVENKYELICDDNNRDEIRVNDYAFLESRFTLPKSMSDDWVILPDD